MRNLLFALLLLPLMASCVKKPHVICWCHTVACKSAVMTALLCLPIRQDDLPTMMVVELSLSL